MRRASGPQAGHHDRAVPGRWRHRRLCPTLAAQFSRLTGKSLVIDNRGGAGGTLGAGIAAKATPDGYTLFMGAVHHTIAPSMYPRLDYDLERDLVPLILVASVPQVLVVNAKAVRPHGLQSLSGAGQVQPWQAQLRLGWRRHLAPPRR
jgi:hypothetical protein